MGKSDPGTITGRLNQIMNDTADGGPGHRLPRRPSASVVPFRSAELEETAAPEAAESLPNRYQIRQRDDEPVLVCEEAPGVAVSIDRRYAFSEAEARRLGERVILLDGAGQFAPLVDDGCHLYNLDHHQGCLRAFTLATCEQALILALQGLRLDKGDWTIYANEPDLDTVFAIWVLLNYRRVRELDPGQRDAILPLLRLEGAIDANGFEIGEYCGLPQEQLRAEKERLDGLHGIELEVKRSGGWGEIDFLQYTHEMLLKIDSLVYRSADFSDYVSVEQVYGHVEIGDDQVAVVCRDSSGIYEVERRLKQVWGERLAIIALERQKDQYTLRRTASLAGIALEEAYGKLNLLDPAVDGRPPGKRWGGSDEIGGSPRPDGTALMPLEIGRILKLTYKRASRWQLLQRLTAAVLWVLGLVLGAGVAVFGRKFLTGVESTPLEAALDLASAGLVIGVGGGLLARKLSRGWIWLFGWRRPAGRDWWALVPAVLLGAAAGGAWIPRQVAADGRSLAAAAAAVVLAAVALEVCFRGLMHGLLILDYRVQAVQGSWFLSPPVVAAGVLYALLTLAVAAIQLWIASVLALDAPLAARWGLMGAGALVAGLALGMIRERSLSLWPGAAALAAGGLLRLAVELW